MAKDKKDAAQEKDAKEAPAEELSPEDQAKKKKKKLILMGAIGGVAVLLIAGGIMFFLSGGSKSAKTVKAGEEGEATEEHGSTEGHEEKKEEHGEKKEGGEHGEKKEGHGGGDKKDAKGKGEHGGGEKKEGGGHGEKKEGHGEKKEGGEHGEKKEGHGGGDKKGKEDKKEGEGSGLDADAIAEYGDVFALKPFHLNLGNAIENRYIRLEVSFHFSGAADQKRELDAKTAQIRDVIGTIVGRKTREFLLARDGKMQLRKEIFDGVNEFLKTPVKDVFITDIMIE